MNNQDANNESIIIEDLNAENTEEIKGGPKRIFIGGLSVTEAATSMPDLEPSGDVRAGCSPIGNHNETVAEDNQVNEAETQKLTDLTVDDDTEAEIKGGYQYRAKRAEIPA